MHGVVCVWEIVHLLFMYICMYADCITYMYWNVLYCNIPRNSNTQDKIQTERFLISAAWFFKSCTYSILYIITRTCSIFVYTYLYSRYYTH